MKRLLTMAALLAATSNYAQNSIDLLTISGFYGSPQPFLDTLASNKAQESGMLVNLKVPVVLSDKTTWYSDLTYMGFNVTTDLNPEPTEFLTSMRLHAFLLQTGIVRKIDEKNGFQLLLVPRFNSDFKGPRDMNTLQMGAIGLYEHRYSEKLLMRFGALYNNELFGPLLTPLVYVDWKMSPRWSMVGLMPISLKVNYKVNDRITAGYSHFGFITSYRLGQEEFKDNYIERSSIDETLFLRWKVFGNFHLEGRIGYSLGRVYQQYEGDEKMDFRLSILGFGDEREQKNVDFNNGPIANLRLVYNLPLE
jgi:hypothetical protein